MKLIQPKENIISKDGRAYTPGRFSYLLIVVISAVSAVLLSSCKDPINIEDNIIKIPAKNDTLNMNGIKPFKKGNYWKYLITCQCLSRYVTDLVT